MTKVPVDPTWYISVMMPSSEARQVKDVYKRQVLGVYGYPSFPLYIIAVHYAVHHLLVVPEDSALVQERIDQRRLSRVYVSYNRDVYYLLFFRHSATTF